MVLPSNSRLVTKREIALGLLSKPLYTGDGSCERYMNHGDKVSFQLFNYKSDFNAEFQINGESHRRIWLSQLNLVYLAADDRDLHCGTICYKNGDEKFLGNIHVEEFIDAVTNRRFLAHVNASLFAIDLWAEKCQSLGTFGAIRDYICAALDEERYDDVRGMTKSKLCYSFIEL